MEPEDYIDLHLHTTASDGNFSPQRLVEEAANLGFDAISITDHDTVGGIKAGKKAAEGVDLELVPGIELNTDYQGFEVHVLGYYIDYEQEEFLSVLQELEEARRRRIKKIVTKLNQLGVEISLSEISDLAGGSVLGRVHIARILLDKGYVTEWEEAFDEYIGRDAPAYVTRDKLTPKEAIELIIEAEGIPIIAHPGLIGNDELLLRFIDWGAKGIEVYHTDHKAEDINRYHRWAKKNELLITGGSDCHGSRCKDGVLMGQIKAPYHLLVELKKLV